MVTVTKQGLRQGRKKLEHELISEVKFSFLTKHYSKDRKTEILRKSEAESLERAKLGNQPQSFIGELPLR